EALAAARRIAEGAPLVNRWHKKFAQRLKDPTPLSAAERAEPYETFDTEDYRAGFRAFLDKQKVTFKARYPRRAIVGSGDGEATAMPTGVPNGAGLYLAALQFLFTLGWTVYAIFLPQLAGAVGIPRTWVIWILLADQVIFAITDYAMGLAADK